MEFGAGGDVEVEVKWRKHIKYIKTIGTPQPHPRPSAKVHESVNECNSFFIGLKI